jgi:hypothetical protein
MLVVSSEGNVWKAVSFSKTCGRCACRRFWWDSRLVFCVTGHTGFGFEGKDSATGSFLFRLLSDVPPF